MRLLSFHLAAWDAWSKEGRRVCGRATFTVLWTNQTLSLCLLCFATQAVMTAVCEIFNLLHFRSRIIDAIAAEVGCETYWVHADDWLLLGWFSENSAEKYCWEHCITLAVLSLNIFFRLVKQISCHVTSLPWQEPEAELVSFSSDERNVKVNLCWLCLI